MSVHLCCLPLENNRPFLDQNIWIKSVVVCSGVANSIIGGGHIFIYSRSQTMKTINFKRN